MAALLRADADALRTLAQLLGARADTVGRLDPSGAAEEAAAAMRLTRFGAACANAGDPVARALSTVSSRIRAMSATANSNADDYQATETAFADELAAYEAER